MSHGCTHCSVIGLRLFDGWGDLAECDGGNADRHLVALRTKLSHMFYAGDGGKAGRTQLTLEQ